MLSTVATSAWLICWGGLFTPWPMLQSVLAAAFLGFYNSHLLTVMFPEVCLHVSLHLRIVPSLTEYLLSIWLDSSTTSNSIEGLYRSASRYNIFKLEFTVDDIRNFLSHQSTYKRHLGFNLQYKQQKHTVVPGPLVKWQMDLADMQNSAEYNDGTNYLLTIIDVFSKYALVIPLQNKQGQTIARALDYIFRIKINNKAYKPMIVLSDNGKEFIAKEVKQRHLGFNLQYKQQKHTVVPGPLVKWQIDLADMQNSAKYNDGTNYLLTIIDNKQGKTIARALDYIFRIKINDKPYKPMILLSDNEKEFIAKEVKQYLSVYRTQRYIDALELITENYNHSYHHTIRELPAN
ncbi:hypothetical protein PROFUN_16824, partial [Planoprotostelium fungivorum]